MSAQSISTAPAAATIHPRWVRICHWINALAILVMIGSGWQIYNASPLFDFLIFPRQIAFNAIAQIPQKDAFLANGYTTEETKMIEETKKIMGDPNIRVSPTCVRIPVKNSHSESINIETEKKLTAAEAVALLKKAPGVVVCEKQEDFPTPAEVSGKGVRARVIAGELGDAKGPASTLMPTFLWHVRIDAGATFEAPIADGHEAAVYVIDGRAVVGEGTQASTGELAVLDGTTGGLRVHNSTAAPLEVMVLGGAPAEGPLVFHGPFVMNSVDQVRAAEIAYRTGRMGVLD